MNSGPRRVAILGSTGSVGRAALEVCAAFPDEYRVTGLCARQSAELLGEQVRRFRPTLVGLAAEDPGAARRIAEHRDVDVVLAAIVGAAGLDATLAALRAGKTVALANKESLVVAGELCLQTARASGATLLPVDSEHSAIFQALCGQRREDVRRILLTASGGPFRTRAAAELRDATVEEALRHPTWRMGRKITIDSATLMNKSLEVIEARWLFGVPGERIEILVHPQSLVHSLVEFVDGSMLAQIGPNDMKAPIAYALSYPRRHALDLSVDLAAVGSLTFERPDATRFPCVGLGHEALRAGGTMPAVLNAANEVAVAAFLEGRLPFAAIAGVITSAMAAHRPSPADDVEVILEADRWARARAAEAIAAMPTASVAPGS
jgi:1-deoxy-D-xylulose-5-phosphate reductoisomerase